MFKKTEKQLLLLLVNLSSVICLKQESNKVGESVVPKGRDDRLLNVFNVVRFPNDGCNTTGDTYGVCYTATECISLGGVSAGTCASGFGVCCAFSGTCGDTTSVNNTYFKSDGSEQSPCRFKVCKSDGDICQIRLGFDTFDILQPSTNLPGDALQNQRTQCIDAQFSASSDGRGSPVICGTNTGQHMILDARDDCNTLSVTWRTSGTRTWNIHVMQISCTAKWKPPEGCLQYFTGTTGYISSFNYLGGYHLANQLYSACVRAERGYCSISYTATDDTSFQLNNQDPGGTSAQGDSCTADYILLSGSGATADDNTNYDRFCGSYLNLDPTSSAQATVYTSKLPFHVGVVFDGTELDDPTAPSTEYSTGFNIYYSQTAC